MKKFTKIICMLLVILLCGCSKGYKEGEYTGTVIDSYGGEDNVASAVVTINSEGKITKVYLDTTYTKDGVKTTKKELGNNYGMSSIASEGEWYQQVEALENAVVENQGIEFITIDEDGKTDAVSGCTIKIDALYEALAKALENAKK